MCHIHEAIEQITTSYLSIITIFQDRSAYLFGCFRLVVSIRCKPTPTVGSLLLSFFRCLNKLLICITGTNFAIYIVVCVLLFFSVGGFCSYVAYFAPNHRHIFFRFSAYCLLSLFFLLTFYFQV